MYGRRAFASGKFLEEHMKIRLSVVVYCALILVASVFIIANAMKKPDAINITVEEGQAKTIPATSTPPDSVRVEFTPAVSIK